MAIQTAIASNEVALEPVEVPLDSQSTIGGGETEFSVPIVLSEQLQ